MHRNHLSDSPGRESKRVIQVDVFVCIVSVRLLFFILRAPPKHLRRIYGLQCTYESSTWAGLRERKTRRSPFGVLFVTVTWTAEKLLHGGCLETLELVELGLSLRADHASC
ncbi:unnamed protein product [Pleuronectes platessa]|uniref:Uncharacterized protein n=1 Tax=Pleuronectes platessa TaxID=8262 RepID=A0A9N7VV93_PLEPL|nr:unnamed protein product [Pleuronectes platessa]